MNNSLRLLKHTHIGSEIWNIMNDSWFYCCQWKWNSCSDVMRKIISCLSYGRMSNIYLGVNKPVGFQCPISIRLSCHGKSPTVASAGTDEGHCHSHCFVLKCSPAQLPCVASTWPRAMRLLRPHDYRERILQRRACVGQGAGESMYVHLELCVLSLGRSQKHFQENKFTSRLSQAYIGDDALAKYFFPRVDWQVSGVKDLPLSQFDFIVPGPLSPVLSPIIQCWGGRGREGSLLGGTVLC